MEDVSQILTIIKRNICVARGYLPVEEYYLLTLQSYECGMKEAEMDVDGFSRFRPRPGSFEPVLQDTVVFGMRHLLANE